MTRRILCIGEVMAELRRDGIGFVVGFAGDTFNTAVYCNRLLGDAGDVDYLTRVGDDPLSDGFLKSANDEGVGISDISRDPVKNLGIYSVQTDPSGERSFAYWRDQSAARNLFQNECDFTALNGADIIYFSGITLAILPPNIRTEFLERLRHLRQSGAALLAFDSNYRPALWEGPSTARQVTTTAWSMTDIALPSIDDEMLLFGDADEASVLARLRDCGCRSGALKRAESGPISINPDALVTMEFAPAEHVVDTTAAGDSFNGGFLAAFAKGLPVQACMAEGHNLARAVVGRRGAIVETKMETQHG